MSNTVYYFLLTLTILVLVTSCLAWVAGLSNHQKTGCGEPCKPESTCEHCQDFWEASKKAGWHPDTQSTADWHTPEHRHAD